MRPIIRWKSFWFGILVLGFLGWAWGRSMGGTEKFAAFSSRGGVVVASELGWISLSRRPAEAGSPRFSYYEQEEVWKGLGIPIPDDAVLWVSHRSWISLSYRLLILAFLVPWTAFLAWRWRRQRILTKAHDAAPAL